MKNKYQLINKRQLLTTCLLMLPLTFSLLAQTPSSVEVQGQINDGTSPIPGATVLIKGGQRGTVSDFNGQYKIIAQANDTLVISYLGYATIEEPVNNRRVIPLIMQQDATTLREVVINAGYYTVKDKERTGSISRITAKEIENQPINNPLEAMQGRMTGVDIVQNSGISGGGFEVRIRGQNSIMAGNAPLYVIDGVPYDAQSLGSTSTSNTILPGGDISPLNAINPHNIESVEILKDADATAIYGSRGANGVILITTKKGKAGKTQLTIASTTGISEITQKRKLLNTEQYLQMRRQGFENDGITEYPFFAYDINGTWDQNRDTDWQEVLIGGTANFQNLQASVSGGNENTQFLINGLTQQETTVFPGDFKYERITVNSNVQHASKDDRMGIAFSAGYTIEDNNLPTSDLSREAMILAPNAPALYDEEGNLNWEENTWTNPLAQLQGKYTNKVHTLIANTVLDYRLGNGFNLKINAGYSASTLEDSRKRPHTIFNPAFGLDSRSSSATLHRGTKNAFILEPQINWSKKGEVGSWEVLLGTSFQNKKDNFLTVLTAGYADNQFLGDLSAANTVIFLNENNTDYKYLSIFGRVNYNFKSKVFVNATARRDGSSRFGPGNRFGNFGAIGMAYLFSEDVDRPWLGYGKIWGSFGITGNDQIGDYQFRNTYIISDFPYEGNIGLQPARLFNPNYKWEQNKKKEIAIELGFLNHRLGLTTAYYNNRSSNQLVNYALPGTTGFPAIQANLEAEVENSGLEFELHGILVQSENVNWKMAVNLSLPKNKLLAFPGLENSSYANQFVIGQPLNIVKLYKFNEVNPETGLYEFEDFNGDGQITNVEDRQYIADFTPEYFGGFSNNIKYKNWNLDIFFQFVKKNAPNEFFNTEPPGTMGNQPIGVLNNWQMAGDNAPIQQYTSGSSFEAYMGHIQYTTSDAVISDASFLRLKSMALGYRLQLGEKEPLSCYFTLQGQNLLTFTKFNGGDPEQTWGFLPQMRRISLGVQLQF